MDVDRYGRTMTWVFENGKNLNEEIVLALKHCKQLLHIDLALHGNLNDAASLVSSWLEMNKIETLNVAGPRASEDQLFI